MHWVWTTLHYFVDDIFYAISRKKVIVFILIALTVVSMFHVKIQSPWKANMHLFYICVSFRNHVWIQLSYGPETPKLGPKFVSTSGFDYFDLNHWPLILALCVNTIFVNGDYYFITTRIAPQLISNAKNRPPNLAMRRYVSVISI